MYSYGIQMYRHTVSVQLKLLSLCLCIKWVACGHEQEQKLIEIYVPNVNSLKAIPNTRAISASYMVLLLIHLLPADSHNFLYSCEQKNNLY